MEVFIVIVFILLFIAIAVFAHLQALKRRKDLKEWAEKHGWRFRHDYDYDMEGRFHMFSCLKTGSRRYGYNITEGNIKDRQLCAFDYHYETYSTDSKGRQQTHHYYFSAVVVQVDLPLKPLFIRTESFFDKIGEFLGFDDIDFESAEFSRTFCVKAPDRRWAFDVLHQEAMEYLLHAPRFTLEFQDRRVIAYRSNIFSIADFDDALEVVNGLLDRLPKSVLRELKGID